MMRLAHRATLLLALSCMQLLLSALCSDAAPVLPAARNRMPAGPEPSAGLSRRVQNFVEASSPIRRFTIPHSTSSEVSKRTEHEDDCNGHGDQCNGGGDPGHGRSLTEESDEEHSKRAGEPECQPGESSCNQHGGGGGGHHGRSAIKAPTVISRLNIAEHVRADDKESGGRSELDCNSNEGSCHSHGGGPVGHGRSLTETFTGKQVRGGGGGGGHESPRKPPGHGRGLAEESKTDKRTEYERVNSGIIVGGGGGGNTPAGHGRGLPDSHHIEEPSKRQAEGGTNPGGGGNKPPGHGRGLFEALNVEQPNKRQNTKPGGGGGNKKPPGHGR